MVTSVYKRIFCAVSLCLLLNYGSINSLFFSKPSQQERFFDMVCDRGADLIQLLYKNKYKIAIVTVFIYIWAHHNKNYELYNQISQVENNLNNVRGELDEIKRLRALDKDRIRGQGRTLGELQGSLRTLLNAVDVVPSSERELRA